MYPRPPSQLKGSKPPRFRNSKIWKPPGTAWIRQTRRFGRSTSAARSSRRTSPASTRTGLYGEVPIQNRALKTLPELPSPGGPTLIWDLPARLPAIFSRGGTHVGAVLSQRNFFVEGEACGGTRRRAVDARSWPFFTLSSLVFVLSEIVFGGCCYFQWILCFGQSFPQDLAAPAE